MTRPIHVGGSYIGLEFAQAYRRFGAEVTLVEIGARPIAREDEDVSGAIRGILEGEAIALRLAADYIGFARCEGGIAVHVACSDGEPVLPASHVRLAVGRRPNTDDLRLEGAGVEIGERSYIVGASIFGVGGDEASSGPRHHGRRRAFRFCSVRCTFTRPSRG